MTDCWQARVQGVTDCWQARVQGVTDCWQARVQGVTDRWQARKEDSALHKNITCYLYIPQHLFVTLHTLITV